MTRYTKIAISLPLRAAETARSAVKAGRAASVSAYVAEAIEERSKQESLAALLDEMLAETGGPMSVTEQRAAERELGIRRSHLRRRPQRRRSRR